jgi:hypothetical protein
MQAGCNNLFCYAGLTKQPGPVPVVQQLSLGDLRENNVTGVYDGAYPWEHSLGFFLAGSVGHDFVAPYSVTLDFSRMVMTVSQSP